MERKAAAILGILAVAAIGISYFGVSYQIVGADYYLAFTNVAGGQLVSGVINDWHGGSFSTYSVDGIVCQSGNDCSTLGYDRCKVLSSEGTFDGEIDRQNFRLYCSPKYRLSPSQIYWRNPDENPRGGQVTNFQVIFYSDCIPNWTVTSEDECSYGQKSVYYTDGCSNERTEIENCGSTGEPSVKCEDYGYYSVQQENMACSPATADLLYCYSCTEIEDDDDGTLYIIIAVVSLVAIGAFLVLRRKMR